MENSDKCVFKVDCCLATLNLIHTLKISVECSIAQAISTTCKSFTNSISQTRKTFTINAVTLALLKSLKISNAILF